MDENKILELLTELYDCIEGEHMSKGIEILETHKNEYPSLKYLLDKIIITTD